MQNARIEIEDRDGWCKTVVLHKAITHIGSDARNDIVLDSWRGSGVSARHAQVIAVGTTCRLVNIGGAEMLASAGVQEALAPVPPLSAVVLHDGAQIKLGDFRLRFFIPSPSALSSTLSPATPMLDHVPQFSAVPDQTASNSSDSSTSSAIGLSVRLSDTALSPERPLEGVVAVRNQGDRAGAQFRLEITGLEPDMFEIGAGPILFPNVEREVPLRIVHSRKSHPPAGDVTFVIRATAPAAYPGQSATVRQVIRILPFYHHVLSVTPWMSESNWSHSVNQ
ncbi:MAG: FHA domain-containing protein [Anaerolineae bacterium]|nr:FHA domain-containing protein [Thermoflexales bacterium]MDW8406737.1 FHA domain-containing protein [Anaerolineae bacterium]